MLEMINLIDYTIIGSYTASESRNFFLNGTKEGFKRFCFSPDVLYSLGWDMSTFADKWSIIANFPIPDEHIRLNNLEQLLVYRHGAGIDVVISRNQIKKRNVDNSLIQLRAIKKRMSDDADIKVIIETGNLLDEDISWVSRELANHLDVVDYVKTSTGFAPRGATPNDIRLISEHVKNIKASGGIRNMKQLLELYDEGATIFGIGHSTAIKIAEELRSHNVEEERTTKERAKEGNTTRVES